MPGTLRIARIGGIQIGLHVSWFVIFGLVLWSLSNVYFPVRHPEWETRLHWLAGLITTILFFVSVLLHEVAHSIVARRVGIEVHEITLFIFGGVASLTREADKPRHEFSIAVAGPLASLLLAVLFGAVLMASRNVSGAWITIPAIAFWLAVINLMLAVFNLLPAFPMDGGRALRALIWGATRDHWLATRISAGLGQGVAYLMILGGILLAISGAVFNAIWIILVGVFLSNAANSGYKQAKMKEQLRGITVDEAMTRSVQAVDPAISLREAYLNFFQVHKMRVLPVVEHNGQLVGVLPYEALRRIPVQSWEGTSVAEAMMAVSETTTVSPEDALDSVIDSLDNQETDETPVVEHGHVVGLLTRSGVFEILQLRERQKQRPAA
jgi:Zn-dependent protease/CBS domain-containing protein